MAFGKLGAMGRGMGHLGALGAASVPLRAVANRGIIPNNRQSISAANLVRQETRFSITIGNADLSELRFVFAGFYLAASNGGETNGGNDVPIQIAVEWPGKTTTQVTFDGGNLQGNIVNGVDQYISDPFYPSQLGLTKFDKGTTFFLRRLSQVPSTGLFVPRHNSSSSSGEVTQYSDGLSASQLLGTGVMTTPTGGVQTKAVYGPAAVIGRPIGTPDIAVLGIGDSIMGAQGEAANDLEDNGSPGGGFFFRGLLSVNSRVVPSGRIAVGGWTANNFVTATKSATYFKYYTHALCEFGRNDMVSPVSRTAAQTFADLKTIWAALKAGGIRHVEQSLIIPSTTSTDSWATTANQTPITNFQTGGTLRDALNTSITGSVGANSLDAILDFGTSVSDTVALDKWAVTGAANYATADGTHPTAAIHAAMGTVLNTRAATWS
jgi:hypothetical protein